MIPDPGQEMDKMSPEYLITADSKEASKTTKVRLSPKGGLTDQRWDSLSFSDSNCNGLKSIKYAYIHQLIIGFF